MPVCRASQTSAIPPVASFLISWYLPKGGGFKPAGDARRRTPPGPRSYEGGSMAFSSIIAAAWLLSMGNTDPVTGKSLAELNRGVSGNYATLEWRDAEDHLDGFIDPATPVEGKPFV